MNTDFRIKVGFFGHHKTRKLKRRHGDAAVLAFLRLLEFTAQYRPRGVLYKMDKEDILDVSGWQGDTEFVDTLEELVFIEKAGHWYEIHDWKEHNGYAFHADDRSEKARQAAEKRWGMRGKKDNDSNT